MSKTAPSNTIRITRKGRKGSNKIRYVAAVPGHIAADSTDPGTPVAEDGLGGSQDALEAPTRGVKDVLPSGSDCLRSSAAGLPGASAAPSPGDVKVADEAKEPVTPGAARGIDAEQGADGDSKVAKRKTPPVTMEAYIAQAYARKGQRVAMSTKLEKSLSTHHRIDELVLGRLLSLAQQDKLLLVPRQILLAAMSVESHPLPKQVLVDFVQKVMQRQPIFGSVLCKQALDPAAPVPNLYSLLKSIKEYNPLVRKGDECPPESDRELLRLNALKLMLVWLFRSKARLEELSAALLQVVWKPAAGELESDVQRIRALTEISEPAAIGWVAEQYLKTATEAQASVERSHREAVALRADLTSARDELAVTNAIAASLGKELELLRQKAALEVTALTQDNQHTRTHLSHDIEVMRGRLVESLRQNVERLETGVAALNREVPRVAVMVERAEIVIESLKLELKALDGEE